MSLRWIYENCQPPVVDEESSDIDDSCSDDSYDSDLQMTTTPDNDDDQVKKVATNGTFKADVCDCSLARRSLKRVSFNDGTNEEVDDSNNVSDNRKSHQEVLLKNPEQCMMRTFSQPVTNGLVHQSLKLKLFCRTGYYVGVSQSGRIKGFTDDRGNDSNVQFLLKPIACRIVKIQNIDTGHYLAFNSTGHIYGESKENKDNTEWEQWNTGKYESFLSHKYADAGWWLAVKNNGRLKPGSKTAWAQKATEFVTIRIA